MNNSKEVRMKNAVLDFGLIKRDEAQFVNSKTQRITITVYSNSEWLLLAKPHSNNTMFSKLFTDETSPISYSVKTKSIDKDRFYPFIQDEYIIIASGKKTSRNGKKLDIKIRLNDVDNQVIGAYTTNIDFVLLTKEKYGQKMKKVNQKPYLSPMQLGIT